VLSSELMERLLEFRREREWEQFHTPRNLAAALSVEAAELLEHFIWASDAPAEAMVAQKKRAIGAELADIAMYLSYLAHDLGIDLESAVRDKMTVNAERYPVEKAKGSSKKYSEF
jgi:NTP pyrophosphatase (non-canonical NTP hydrolase)